MIGAMARLGSTRTARRAAAAGLACVVALVLLEQSLAGPSVPRRIRVPGTPLAIATGYGSVWVAGHDSTTLFRINPATGRIRGRFNDDTNACGPLGVAFGDIWVGPCDSSPAATAVRASTGRVVGHVNGIDMGFGAGSAWTDSGDGSPTIELRVDPHSFRVVSRIRVGNGGGWAAAGGGFVWRVNADDGTVSQIDPARNTVTRTIRYGSSGAAFPVFTAGALWVFDARDNAIYKLAPAHAKFARLPVRLHDGGSSNGDPYLLVVGRRIWVALSGTKLGAIDPRVSKVVKRISVPDGFGPYFAIAYGSIWGTLPPEDLVVRTPLRPLQT